MSKPTQSIEVSEIAKLTVREDEFLVIRFPSGMSSGAVQHCVKLLREKTSLPMDRVLPLVGNEVQFLSIIMDKSTAEKLTDPQASES
jgi:hypothetical protein